MLIECLIKREGHTVVNIQRSKYEFKRNENDDQVCDILSGSHSEYLLKLQDFRIYEPKVVEIPEEIQPVIEEENTEKVREEEKAKEPEKRTFACRKCSKVFNHQSSLSAHKRKCK